VPDRFFLTSEIAGIADPPRMNIAPGQEVITLTVDGPQHMRWGMIPVGRVNARGRPVMETIVNARSETVFDKSAFVGVKRAVVPVDGWYEWTGAAQAALADYAQGCWITVLCRDL
jgi:putative SOS response-associated peptidase YedK